MQETIAVYGAGTIGACEATLCIGNGCPTIVIGHSQKGMEHCKQIIEKNWDDLIAEGLATNTNKIAAMRLLTITDKVSALRPCTFIFEAVPEDMETKQEVYKQIEKICSDRAVIASCTSSISADLLAALFQKPERFLIAHPFQPVHLMPLVEVVCSQKTEPDIVGRTKRLLEYLHCQVVLLKKSVPGFLANRFAQALFREAIYLLEEGVTTAEEIDTAVKYAIGMRYASIGLLEYFDDVGFELESTIAKNVYPDLCSTKELQKTHVSGLASGQTGRASGIGLYNWNDKDLADYFYRKQAPFFNRAKQWSLP